MFKKTFYRKISGSLAVAAGGYLIESHPFLLRKSEYNSRIQSQILAMIYFTRCVAITHFIRTKSRKYAHSYI